MTILGRKGCDEQRDWSIIIFHTEAGDSIRFSEQLIKKDAEKIFSELKTKFNNREKSMEVVTAKGNVYFLNKDHIQCIALEKD